MTKIDTANEAQSDVEFYLPAMPRLSTTTGRVERFVTTLLRRRGGLRLRVRTK